MTVKTGSGPAVETVTATLGPVSMTAHGIPQESAEAVEAYMLEVLRALHAHASDDELAVRRHLTNVGLV